MGGLPYRADYVFDSERKWELDVAWPPIRFAIELQGGGWVRGKHHRPVGYNEDCRKALAATLAGWRIVWLTKELVVDEAPIHIPPLVALVKAEFRKFAEGFIAVETMGVDKVLWVHPELPDGVLGPDIVIDHPEWDPDWRAEYESSCGGRGRDPGIR